MPYKWNGRFKWRTCSKSLKQIPKCTHIFDVNLCSLCLRLSVCVYEKIKHLSSSILTMSNFEPFIPYLWEAEIHHLDRDQHIFNQIENGVKIQSVTSLKHFRHTHSNFHFNRRTLKIVSMITGFNIFFLNSIRPMWNGFWALKHLEYLKLMLGKRQDSMPFVSTHWTTFLSAKFE